MNSISDSSAPNLEAEPTPVARVPFSPAEKWLFAGVIVIVLALVVPLMLGLQARRMQQMAHSDIQQLITSINRYFAEYGRWPTARMGTVNDVRYGDERCNSEVVNMLRAIEGPGNEQHRGNPLRIVFIEIDNSGFQRSGIRADGAFVDPWGMPYQIALDTDMNDIVTMIRSAYPNLMGANTAIWSYGPDRRSDTAQDIVSWN